MQQVGRHWVGPYREAQGHHPHQQAARSNNPNYDRYFAISVQNGTFDHGAISALQAEKHREFLKSGGTIQNYNLGVEEAIQRQAMRAGGFTDGEIEEILQLSRQELIRQGALNPTRVPWGP